MSSGNEDKSPPSAFHTNAPGAADGVAVAPFPWHMQRLTQRPQALQAAGLIRYSRGTLGIEDRAGLQGATCECYRVIADLYNRLLPRTPRAGTDDVSASEHPL